MKRESNALLKVIPLLSFSITLRNDDEESKFSLPSKMAEPHGFNDVTNQPIEYRRTNTAYFRMLQEILLISAENAAFNDTCARF